MGTARIRILRGVSGLDFAWGPGEVVDLPADEAAKWADGERAEYVGEGFHDTMKAAAEQFGALLDAVAPEPEPEPEPQTPEAPKPAKAAAPRKSNRRK